MPIKQLLILGGYGNTGLPIARLLLAETEVAIRLAGRNLGKAELAVNKLNAEFKGDRVRGVHADAGDPHSLLKAFDGMDMVVVASSTADQVENVARCALQAGVDYLDVQYSTRKMELLQSLSSEIAGAERCFITDGGFHPGLPAAMVRFASAYFDQLESANVGSVIKVDWRSLELSPETIQEFVGEFMSFQTLHYKNGRWQNASALAMMIPRFMNFGGKFGRQYCIPMFLEEMRRLPNEYPSLHETGFFVGGFNWFVDWFLSPVIMLGLKLFPKKGLRPLGRLMLWGLEIFSRPPYGTQLKLEASGTKDKKPGSLEMIIAHADGYMLTAIPVVACLMQYLEGTISKPGLYFQAHIVEPKQFFRDMGRMGAEIRMELKP